MRHIPPPPSQQPPQPPPAFLDNVRTKDERLPESSEVVIDPRGRGQCKHVSHVSSVARGLKPSYAASARQVLMSSTRGLMKLQGSLSSNTSSLYINDTFQDGAPCPAIGCPLNPKTIVRSR